MIWPLAAIAVAQLASLRAYYIYLPPGVPIAVAVAAASLAAVAGWMLLRRGLLRPAWVLMAVAVITVFEAFYLYPIADARRAINLGSDQDDAVIDMARGFMRGEYPFATPTYLQNPPSPGPAWVLAHLPFVVVDAYIVVPVLSLAAALLLLARHGGLPAAAAAMIIAGTAPVFWEALAIGSDQFTVGCLALAFVLLLDDVAHPRAAVSAAILGVVLATSRVVYPYIPALGALLVAPTSRARAIAWLAAAAATLLHAGFFLWRPDGYGPMNIINRADASLPGWWKYAIAFSTLAAVAAAWRSRPRTLAARVFSFAWCLAVPLGWMMLGRGHDEGPELLMWGANYLVPALLPLAAGAALNQRWR